MYHFLNKEIAWQPHLLKNSEKMSHPCSVTGDLGKCQQAAEKGKCLKYHSALHKSPQYLNVLTMKMMKCIKNSVPVLAPDFRLLFNFLSFHSFSVRVYIPDPVYRCRRLYQ